MPDRKSTRLNSSHSLYDALPIYFIGLGDCLVKRPGSHCVDKQSFQADTSTLLGLLRQYDARSEEHTSELQSLPIRRSSDLFHRTRRLPRKATRFALRG